MAKRIRVWDFNDLQGLSRAIASEIEPAGTVQKAQGAAPALTSSTISWNNYVRRVCVSPILEIVQQPKLFGGPHESQHGPNVIFGFKPVVGLPVHIVRFILFVVQGAGLAA
jgi:hypothetical protein